MPFEDLSGNTGFTSDSEGAEANLNISMSEDSARNLWDVQAAVQQIATDFQTAVRAAADFNSYLISIRETGQTVKMPSMGNMEGGESGNMSYSGGRVDTGSVPLIQSEQSQASRISEMEENSGGMGGGALAAAAGARALSGGRIDPGAFVGNLTQAAFLASATGQHGAHPQATSDAYQKEYQFAQANPLDPQVLGSGPGGRGGTPHTFAASSIVSQGLPAAQQFLRGGGVGGFASILGRLGTIGAVGYAGYQLGNAALETYAQSRSLGIATNNSDHGAAWGFGTRMSQLGMAMSPFVSQEEAGQIYGTAVSQGWASRRGGLEQGTFGQAVNFMYGAAKDYNMDPAMAGQLLQSNSLGAGESIVALNQQLLTLKQTLDGTGVSMDAASSTFTNFTGMLIASGATGGTAAQIAGGAMSAYSGNTYLRNGRGAEIVQQTMGTQQTQNILAALTGTLPGAALAGQGHLEASTKELDRLTKRFTDEIMGMGNLDEAEKGAYFAQMYNATFGTNITTQDALNMMAVNVSNPGALTEGQKDYVKQQGISYKRGDDGRNAWDRFVGSMEGRAKETGWMSWVNPGAYVHAGSTMFSDTGGWENTTNSFKNYSPEVQKLIETSSNPDKLSVLDSGGNAVATGKDAVSKWFSSPGNYEKFSATGSKYSIKDQGSSYNATNIGGAVNTEDMAGSTDTNTVYIKLSAEAKRLIDTDKTSLPMDTGHS